MFRSHFGARVGSQTVAAMADCAAQKPADLPEAADVVETVGPVSTEKRCLAAKNIAGQRHLSGGRRSKQSGASNSAGSKRPVSESPPGQMLPKGEETGDSCAQSHYKSGRNATPLRGGVLSTTAVGGPSQNSRGRHVLPGRGGVCLGKGYYTWEQVGGKSKSESTSFGNTCIRR